MNAQDYINRIAEGSSLLEDTPLVKLAYSKLSSKMRRRVTKLQLADFVDALENGANLDSAARTAKLPTVIAVDLLSELDRSGLL